MRQAGILAAAGIIAIEEMTGYLAEDHRRARAIAAGLRDVPGLVLDAGDPPSNMVYLNLAPDFPRDATEIAAGMEKQGVRVGVINSRRFRLVTHYWIDDEAVQSLITAFRQVMGTFS
jgi:threonine aldolase